MVPENVVEWLLTCDDPWVEYRTRLDLLGQFPTDKRVIASKQRLLKHPAVQSLLAELTAWPGPPLTSHKSAGHLLHKLVYITDIGIQAGDPGMDRIIDAIRAHSSQEGIYQILGNIPKHFGGNGLDQGIWMLCDAPLVVYALGQAVSTDADDVRHAAQVLSDMVKPNGWPCAASQSAGNFRGPGNKADPCPYANLMMLKMLAQFPTWHQSPAVLSGCETALQLWAERSERHPYLFRMGTDFCKVKAPLVWYDLLHSIDVLSRYPNLREDPRLLEMSDILRSKADSMGLYTPESIWTAWKGWDFGQKKTPSAWLTFLAWRALDRIQS